ncbi:hypothetical protein ACRAWB_13050 [Leifsonia poae]|uniref:hypothetical protein n=1 Tax=Leifsonia poae TaxID=110933 RepID=UPI003D690755
MTMSDDQSADTPIFDSRRDALEPEAGLPETVLPEGTAGTTGGTSTSSTGGQGGSVKDEASRVTESAKQAGKDVAGTAKEQAKNVAGEAKSQARELYHQTQRELRDQAAHQQERVASGLHSVGDELDQMASSSQQGGIASDLVRQVGQRAHSIAGWLDQRDPGSLLNEVKSYARRNPGTFIAAAAIAGALAGRLTRALASGGDDSSNGNSGSASTDASYTGTTASTGTTAGYSGSSVGYAAGTGSALGDDDLYDDGVGTEVPPLPGAGYTGGRP